MHIWAEHICEGGVPTGTARRAGGGSTEGGGYFRGFPALLGVFLHFCIFSGIFVQWSVQWSRSANMFSERSARTVCLRSGTKWRNVPKMWLDLLSWYFEHGDVWTCWIQGWNFWKHPATLCRRSGTVCYAMLICWNLLSMCRAIHLCSITYHYYHFVGPCIVPNIFLTCIFQKFLCIWEFLRDLVILNSFGQNCPMTTCPTSKWACPMKPSFHPE